MRFLCVFYHYNNIQETREELYDGYHLARKLK